MKALIVSYKRGRHLIHPRHALLKIPGISDRKKAQTLTGKKVFFTTKSGKIIKGIISQPHGDKGVMRARFTKGLPGQAIGQEVTINETIKTEKETKKPVKKETKK